LRSPSRLWIVIAAVVAIGIGIYAFRALSGPKVRVAVASRGDLVQSVVATGRVIASSRIEIGTQIAGVVDTVEGVEGMRLEAGQTLATLRAEEQQAAVVQAQAALDEARARLAQFGATTLPVAEQQLRQADANVALARSEHARVSELVAAGFFSRAKLDEAHRNLDTAMAQQRAAQTQAEAARPRGSEVSLAYAREAQARAALDVAKAKLAYTRIFTPVTGVLLKRDAEPGDLVAAGTKLFTVGAGDLQAQFMIDEKNLSLIAMEQTAELTADAYPGRKFLGRVVTIAPSVDVQRGTVEVRLALPQPPDYVRVDMTVSAEIVAARRTGVLMIDSEGVRGASGASPWVLAVRDGRAVRVPVKVGARGTGKVELLDGLKEGDMVVPPAELAVVEGTKVRPAKP
jgi:HlyD family secretion protein